MREKKRIVPLFSFYDVTGMEAYLEKMAQKGWVLDHITNLLWHFRRCTPKTVHYAVTYYPAASAFAPEPSEGQETFRDFCDHAGWRCVGENAQIMIFANEQENPTPVHTDPEVELETLERMSKRLIWLWVMLLVLLTFNFCMSIRHAITEPIALLASSMQQFSMLLILFIDVYFIADIFTWFRWRKRARAAAEQGEFLPTHGHHRLLAAALLIPIPGLLYSTLTARQPEVSRGLLFYLVGYVVLYAAVNGTRVLLKKKKVSTGTNRAITLAVDVVLAFALVGGVMWYISHQKPSPRMDSTPALTIEALTGRSDPEDVQELRTDSSFLLSRTNLWQHPSFDREGPMDSLHYEQIDVHFSPLYDFCLRQLLHQYDDYGDHEPDYDEEHPFYVFQEIDAAPWGADRAYQRYSYGEADSVYLLCWPKRLVELSPSDCLSPEQISTVKTAFAP